MFEFADQGVFDLGRLALALRYPADIGAINAQLSRYSAVHPTEVLNISVNPGQRISAILFIAHSSHQKSAALSSNCNGCGASG